MKKHLSGYGVLFVVLGTAIACSSQARESSSASGAAAKASAVAAVTPKVLEHGRGVYNTNCAPCHGESGRGDGPGAGALNPKPRDHTDRTYMSSLTNDDLAKVIQMGGAIKGKPLMPSNPQIRGTDLDALVAYTRSLSASKP